MIRFLDLLFSIIGLLLLSPLFILLAIVISLDSRGGVFFVQERVGRGRVPFGLIKFRSMKPASEKKGQLTVGLADARITGTGKFLRKFKLDEFPQLINVVKGEMSLVGPRPEVPRYVEHYSEQELLLLDVRPGMTDRASIEFMDENEILGRAEDPEKAYIKEVLPQKLSLSKSYALNPSVGEYLSIIFKTIFKIIAN